MKYIFVITLEIYSIDDFQFVALAGYTSHQRAWKSILDSYRFHKDTLNLGHRVYDVISERDQFSFAEGDALETIRRYQYSIQKIPLNPNNVII